MGCCWWCWIGGGANVSIGDTAPPTPGAGDLWWDSAAGRLFVYYIDIDSAQWVDASPNISGSNGSNVFSGPNAPANGVEGALWYNTTTNQLYVFTNSQWVATQNAVAGVGSVTGTLPITVTGTATDPVVGVTAASASDAGVIRISTQAEVNAATDATTALTPAKLAAGIVNYLPRQPNLNLVLCVSLPLPKLRLVLTPQAITPATLNAALTALGLANPLDLLPLTQVSTAPDGYLLCDGAAVSRVTYADLFAVVGETFGAGDGSTTFNVPDLRGEFIRGFDDGRGADAGRVFGSFQADEFKAHDHNGVAGDPGTDPARLGGANRSVDTDTYTTSPAGGVETRPRNVALNHIIKT